MANEVILVMVRTDIRPEIEAAWNEWYDSRHIPDRLKIPGFLSARRYVAVEGEPKYVSVYDLASTGVLASDPYLKLRDEEYASPPESFERITGQLPNISRGLYRQIFPEPGTYRMPETDFLFVVGFDVPALAVDEFNAWYNTEHIPGLLKVPGFASARRFMAVEEKMPERAGKIKTEPRFIALYDLKSADAIHSEAFAKVVETPWTQRMRTLGQRRVRFLGWRIYPKG